MSKSYCPCCGKVQRKLKGGLYICQKKHEGPMGVTEEENERLAERRITNRLYKAVSIQIGDEEGSHADLYYRLTGVHGNFVLKTFRKTEKYNSVDEKYEYKETAETRYYGNLEQIMKKVATMELTDIQAATMPELLEVIKGVYERIESLEDALFYIGNDNNEEEEEA